VFYGDQLDSPNSRSDWKISAFAHLTKEYYRAFDDTTEEGIGFRIFIPEGASNVEITYIIKQYDEENMCSANVRLNIYTKPMPDGAWSIASRHTLTVDGKWKIYTKTLNQLGLKGNTSYQFEITRDAQSSDDTLVGDLLLSEIRLKFNAGCKCELVVLMNKGCQCEGD